MAVRLLAQSAGRAHALTINHNGLLDDAARLAIVVAEAADNPHLLRDILRNGDMYRLRAAQERIEDVRAARSPASAAGTRSCTSSPGAGTAAGSRCTSTGRTRAGTSSARGCATGTGTTRSAGCASGTGRSSAGARTTSRARSSTGRACTARSTCTTGPATRAGSARTCAAGTTARSARATTCSTCATTAALFRVNFLQWPVTVIHRVWRKEVQR
jgi:hypothetical protein